jgi:hypothetical protein
VSQPPYGQGSPFSGGQYQQPPAPGQPMPPAAPPSGYAGIPGPLPPAPPPYGAGPGPYPTAPPPPRRVDGLAIAALVLGAVGFVILTLPVAIILAVIALVRIGRTGGRGRGLAVSALIVSVLWIAGWSALIAYGINLQPHRDDNGNITTKGRVSSGDLRVGDCIVDVSEGDVKGVDVVPCTQAHKAEVITRFTVPGSSYPGDSEVDSTAESRCQDDVPSSLQERDDLDLFYLAPRSTTWSTGNHSVSCLVVSNGAALTASVR